MSGVEPKAIKSTLSDLAFIEYPVFIYSGFHYWSKYCGLKKRRQHVKGYLVSIHFALDELGPPELQCLVQCDADALEEEAVLHAPAMAEVVVVPQGLVELPHAQGVGLDRELEGKAMDEVKTSEMQEKGK